MNQENFINNLELREKSMCRIDVLEKVKSLILLSGTEFATTEQVAVYFEVNKDVIKKVIQNNNDELLADGIITLTGKETKEFLVGENISLTNFKGYFIADNQKFSNNKTVLLPKRAILRVAMLLRDSEIAKEIRTRLLDVMHDVETEKDNVIENIIKEVDEEKKLILDRAEAEYNGDTDSVSIINSKLFALKNKRIKELENELSILKTHALTLIESRDIINKLVRKIAMLKYNGNFGKAYSDLYSTVNYKLSINIKSRNKKNGESYLNTLTEEETFEVELIVKSWADEVGINVEDALKLPA